MNKIRQIREMKGLNQRQLAEKAHTAQSLISNLEHDRMKPWPKVIRRLSRVLKVSRQELFPEEWK
jgi:transcriptional regulator with XRE-family HTH domain